MKEVRIDIVEDEAHYSGNALITFHSAVLPPGRLHIHLSRKSSDTPYLGADGWQASPAPLEVELVSQAAGKTVLRAGPEICDRIPYSLFVRVEIVGSGLSGQAFWPEIMQSPKNYSAVLGDVKLEQEPVKADAEPEQRPVEPPPVFEPPPVTDVASPIPVKKKSVWTVLLPLLLLFIGAGAVAFWQRDAILPGKMADADVPQPPAEAPAEALSAKFDRLKQSDAAGNELFALSEEAFAAGDRAIGQQSIALSVERGNEAAKLQRAKWYDPKTFAADRVEAIDANAAARAYFELALGGNAEATTLLKTICDASKAGGDNFKDFLDTTYCQGDLSP